MKYNIMFEPRQYRKTLLTAFLLTNRVSVAHINTKDRRKK